MFIDDFPFSDNLKVILNTFYLSHTVWLPKSLENTWLASALSALCLTFESDEIVLKLAQASAMLGELGLKTDESQPLNLRKQQVMARADAKRVTIRNIP